MMYKWVFASAILCIPFIANAGQLNHSFKSPAFSGQGYSSHVLTIENQEFSRKKAINVDEA